MIGVGLLRSCGDLRKGNAVNGRKEVFWGVRFEGKVLWHLDKAQSSEIIC